MSKMVSMAEVLALIEAAIADKYMSPVAKLYRLRYEVQDLPTINDSICSDADTISRQAAIDESFEIYVDGQKFEVVQVETLMGLPSAKSEIIRCKDCRHGVDYYHEGDCYCSNPKWGLKYFGGSWEFYCADAERRTDG